MSCEHTNALPGRERLGADKQFAVGDVVLSVNSVPLDLGNTPTQLTDRICAAKRPVVLVIFRGRIPGSSQPTNSLAPTNLTIAGVLFKRTRTGGKSRRGSFLGRPWHERFVEVTAEGVLVNYKGTSKAAVVGGTMELRSCQLYPLNKDHAGRDFAFEVFGGTPGIQQGQGRDERAASMAGHESLDDRSSFSSPTPATPDGVRESLTLAANSREEATRWYALLRDAIGFHTERATLEAQKHTAQVAKIRSHLGMLKESYVTERQRAENANAEAERIKQQEQAVSLTLQHNKI